MRTWITQLRKGLLEFCVLNAISGGETYGYELVQRLKGMEQLAVTESTIYPILNRLRQNGYVKLRDAPSASGPPRQYYSLTRVGRHHVDEMNIYWDELSEALEVLRNTTSRRQTNENK